jgi:STE24 endopeptidase
MNDIELFSSFGFSHEARPVIIGFLLFSQTIWAPVEHVLSFLITLNTRRNEFQADAFAVELGYGEELKSGLTKISIENLSNMNPDTLYSAYHYSHPPLVERLTAVAQRQSENKKKKE